MSQYIEFFINPAISESFYLLDCYSRSNYVYQVAVNYVPYGKITLLNRVIPEINKAIDEEIKQFMKLRTRKEDMIESVKSFSDLSIEDRIEAIEQYKNDVEEINEEIVQLEFARNFYCILNGFDENLHIYAGIEVGEPTKEDII